MAELLDGKKIKEEKAAEIKKVLAGFSEQLTMAIIQVGDREDSNAYIAGKKKFADDVGALVRHVKLSDTASTSEVVEQIQALNADEKVHGVIVQLPLPESIDKDLVLSMVDAQKDVDGLGALNIERLWEGRETAIIPATTRGILTLLDYYKIPVEGKKITLVGRSSLVGKPTALALINLNATVTVCHSKTANLAEETKAADILIVAIGKPAFITKEYVKPGQIVIDVGINSPKLGKLEDEVVLPKLIGDVDYTEVKEIVGAITPVPGGVGQLTVVSLFQNLIDVYRRYHRDTK